MIATWSKRLLDRLKNKRYRAAYVEQNVKTGIAYQIRTLRGVLSQAEFGKKIEKPQSVISRLEDPDYGKLSVQTLLEVAASLDIALLVKFVTFPEFIRQTRDVSPEGLNVAAYDPAAFEAVNVANSLFRVTPPLQQGNIEGARVQYNAQVPTGYVIPGNLPEINRDRLH